jgi:hypothetical protein
VTDGGLRLESLEPGSTRIRVVGFGRVPHLRCPVRVAHAGRVHDALTLRFVR